MLQNRETKNLLIEFFSEILNIRFKDIIFKGLEEFKSIIEYDFYLINLIGITDKNSQKELFIKRIKKGKIKESLFCICDLAYDKYFNKDSNDEKNKFKKIAILEQKEKFKNKSKVSVKLYKGTISQDIMNIEINFVEICSILEQIESKNIIKKGWRSNIEINQNDIMIIGVKN